MSENFYVRWPQTGGGGVTSLNSLTGALNLVAGTGISITPSGTNITITNTSLGVLTIGTIDSEITPSANGATINGTALIMQSASASVPGLVNNTTQSFSGNKTLTANLAVQGSTSLDNGAITTDGSGNYTSSGNIYLTNSNSELKVEAILATNGALVIDLGNLLLKDASQGYHRVDWGNGLLIDNLNVLSIDWDNRTLYNSAGTKALGYGANSISASSVLLTDSSTNLTSVAAGTSGHVLTSNGTTWVSSAPATSGTVTSVGFSDASTTPIYTIGSTPVTTSGTITQTLTTQSANTVFSGPSSGSAAQPSFRSLVSADIPTSLPLLTSASTLATVGTIGTGTWQGSLISASYGGLGNGTWTAGSIPYVSSSTAFAQDNSNFTWNDTNKQLFVGSASGSGSVNVNITSSTYYGLSILSTQSSPINTSSNGYPNVFTNSANSSAQPSTVNLQFTRGTPASKSASNSGDLLGRVTFNGYTGSAYTTNASVDGLSTQAGGTGSGGQISLKTVPNGSTTLTQALLLDQNQNATFANVVNIGTAASQAGTLGLANGSGSGALLTLSNPSATTAYTFAFPATIGTTGYALTSSGTSGTAATWSSVLTNPMTTSADLIYGGASGVPTRLANGSLNQVLTSAGGTTAPTWSNPATGSYAQAYFPAATTWSTTSTSYADPTISGSDTLTVRQSSGITLTAGGSSVAGITFTPAASTAVYLIVAQLGAYNSGAADVISYQMTDGTTVISGGSAYAEANPASNGAPVTITGVYVPGTSSAVTVKVQVKVSAGTGYIQVAGGISGAYPLEWTVIRIF